MTSNWTLAKRETITAFFGGNHLIFLVTGNKPSPCHVVDIEAQPITLDPPHFALRWRQVGLCTEAVTPYQYLEAFPAPSHRPAVVVHHQDGADVITVVKVESTSLSALAPSGVPERVVQPVGVGPRTGARNITLRMKSDARHLRVNGDILYAAFSSPGARPVVSGVTARNTERGHFQLQPGDYVYQYYLEHGSGKFTLSLHYDDEESPFQAHEGDTSSGMFGLVLPLSVR